MTAPSARFLARLSLSAASGFLGLLTLIQKDWIEAVTRWDPDRHAGSVEWAVAGALLALALVFAQSARVEWRDRRRRPAVLET